MEENTEVPATARNILGIIYERIKKISNTAVSFPCGSAYRQFSQSGQEVVMKYESACLIQGKNGLWLFSLGKEAEVGDLYDLEILSVRVKEPFTAETLGRVAKDAIYDADGQRGSVITAGGPCGLMNAVKEHVLSGSENINPRNYLVHEPNFEEKHPRNEDILHLYNPAFVKDFVESLLAELEPMALSHNR